MTRSPTESDDAAPIPSRVSAPAPPPRRWTRLRGVLAVAGLAALAGRVGTGPILDALAGLTAPTVLIALGLGALATATSALRWRAVARALGVELPAGVAWAGIYRATLLNSVLPEGFSATSTALWAPTSGPTTRARTRSAPRGWSCSSAAPDRPPCSPQH